MLASTAAGVWLFIYFGMMSARTNVSQRNKTIADELEYEDILNAQIEDDIKQHLLQKKKAGDKLGAVCGVIMIVATWPKRGLFRPVLSSPDPSSFEPKGTSAMWFWTAWPVGGMLCGIVALLMNAFGRRDERRRGGRFSGGSREAPAACVAPVCRRARPRREVSMGTSAILAGAQGGATCTSRDLARVHAGFTFVDAALQDGGDLSGRGIGVGGLRVHGHDVVGGGQPDVEDAEGPSGAPVASIQVLSMVSGSATSFASSACAAFKNGTSRLFRM